MKTIWITIVLTVTFSQNVISQNQIESLLEQRETKTIQGKVPTYYTPGYRDVALDFQETITDAINYYEKKYSKTFQIKLIVLDSNQWLTEMVPYGYVFYDQGWIVMNTGMAYENFKEVYGLEDIYQHLDNELKKRKINSEEIIKSFYKVYSIHELGHYFISELSNTKSPDKSTNEFIATYFSYEFFESYKPNELTNFEIFHGVHKDFYIPNYSTIKDFNEIYGGMGVKNYVWYHSNFYFLVKSLYIRYGIDFLSIYEDLFPKDAEIELATNEIIDLLDKDDLSETVKNWVDSMENKTRN